MKKSEIRKLVAMYKELQAKSKNKNLYTQKILEKIKEIKHRYYHETGRDIEDALN